MTYQGRALYNLLQMNLKQNPSMEVEKWQVENYRAYSQEELFKGLEDMEVFLSEDNFLLYVDECDSPEDLADCLYLEGDFQKHEKIFLIVFELWRRLAPHKQSLSLFVDEFDHLIELYEEGKSDSEDDLQAALSSFQMILDDNVDEGGEPKEGYHFFSEFSCHDLEVFLYEYASHQLDSGNETYASELVEGFYTYVDNGRWFDLLRTRLVTLADEEEGKVMLERLLASLKDEPDLYLLFEALQYLIHVEEAEQFQMAYMQALDAIETAEDLHELLTLTAEYFNAIEKEKEEGVVLELIEEIKSMNPEEKVAKDHRAFQILRELITLSPA